MVRFTPLPKEDRKLLYSDGIFTIWMSENNEDIVMIDGGATGMKEMVLVDIRELDYRVVGVIPEVLNTCNTSSIIAVTLLFRISHNVNTIYTVSATTTEKSFSRITALSWVPRFGYSSTVQITSISAHCLASAPTPSLYLSFLTPQSLSTLSLYSTALSTLLPFAPHSKWENIASYSIIPLPTQHLFIATRPSTLPSLSLSVYSPSPPQSLSTLTPQSSHPSYIHCIPALTDTIDCILGEGSASFSKVSIEIKGDGKKYPIKINEIGEREVYWLYGNADIRDLCEIRGNDGKTDGYVVLSESVHEGSPKDVDVEHCDTGVLGYYPARKKGGAGFMAGGLLTKDLLKLGAHPQSKIRCAFPSQTPTAQPRVTLHHPDTSTLPLLINPLRLPPSILDPLLPTQSPLSLTLFTPAPTLTPLVHYSRKISEYSRPSPLTLLFLLQCIILATAIIVFMYRVYKGSERNGMDKLEEMKDSIINVSESDKSRL